MLRAIARFITAVLESVNITNYQQEATKQQGVKNAIIGIMGPKGFLTVAVLTLLRKVLQILSKLLEPLKFLSIAFITSCEVSIWFRCRLK